MIFNKDSSKAEIKNSFNLFGQGLQNNLKEKEEILIPFEEKNKYDYFLNMFLDWINNLEKDIIKASEVNNFLYIDLPSEIFKNLQRYYHLQKIQEEYFQGSFKFKYNSRYVEDENGNPATKLFITFYW